MNSSDITLKNDVNNNPTPDLMEKLEEMVATVDSGARKLKC